ncbi:MAG: hypothetical protein R3208_01400 [Ketobacteraceae bacterium]|nr:hypothetical protein [Ketobacteraceae bacterium]
MINRIFPVLFCSLFLAACGGGGGGGSSDSSGDGGNNNQGGDAEEETFTQQQNAYLPLIVGAGWEYSAEDKIIAEAYGTSGEYFALPSEFILTLAEEGTPAEVSQILSSNPNTVGLKGFVGSDFSFDIEEGVEVTLKSLIFDEEILLLGGSVAPGSVAGEVVFDLNSKFLPIPLNNVRVDVTATPIINVSDSTVSTPWGTLAAKEMDASLRVTGTYSTPFGPIPINITITETSYFVAGIGPVSRSITYYLADSIQLGEVSLDIAALINLPEPIVYVYDGLNLNSPENTVMRMRDPEQVDPAYTNLDPAQYSLLNEEEFNAIAWASVQESPSGTAFEVSASLSDPVPSITESAVIYVKENGSNNQVPVNVTFVNNEGL